MAINPVLQTGLLNQSSAQVIDGSLKFDDNYLNQITSFLNGGDDDGTYQFNSCLELTQGRLIPINSYAVM